MRDLPGFPGSFPHYVDTSPGHSGSALYDPNGNVVGVHFDAVQATKLGVFDYNVAYGASALQALFTAARVPPNSPNARKALPINPKHWESVVQENTERVGKWLVVPHAGVVERRKRSGTQAKRNELYRAISDHPSVALEARGNNSRRGAFFDDDGQPAASSSGTRTGTSARTAKNKTPAPNTFLRQANYTEPLTVSSARIAGHTRLKKFTADTWMELILSALDFFHIEHGTKMTEASPDAAEKYDEWLADHPFEIHQPMLKDVVSIPMLANEVWTHRGQKKRGFEHMGTKARDFYFTALPQEINALVLWADNSPDIISAALIHPDPNSAGTFFRVNSAEYRQLGLAYRYLTSKAPTIFLKYRHEVLATYGHPSFRALEKAAGVLQEATRRFDGESGWWKTAGAGPQHLVAYEAKHPTKPDILSNVIVALVNSTTFATTASPKDLDQFYAFMVCVGQPRARLWGSTETWAPSIEEAGKRAATAIPDGGTASAVQVYTEAVIIVRLHFA